MHKLESGHHEAGAETRAQPHDELTTLVADLFEQYHAAIFAYLYRLVNDREWAHDLTQETFLRVFQTRQRLPQVENLRAWVYRIATNTAHNALKRHRRFAWLPWHQTDLSKPDTAEQSDRRIAIEQALAELPPHYRVPLLLYSHHGFSVREVAETLDIKQGAVKTRLYRAREMFRKTFERGNQG